MVQGVVGWTWSSCLQTEDRKALRHCWWLKSRTTSQIWKQWDKRFLNWCRICASTVTYLRFILKLQCWNWGEKPEIHQRDQRFGVWAFWGHVSWVWSDLPDLAVWCGQESMTCCGKTIWRLQRYHIHKKNIMFWDKQSFLARRDLPWVLVYVLI